MKDNFLKAVEFANNELQGFYDRGGSFSALNQKGRSEILEVFSGGPSIPITNVISNLNKIAPNHSEKWRKITF